MIFANILCASNAYAAQELQAQVAKAQKNYTSIEKLIEYNHYEEADEKIREMLNKKPKKSSKRQKLKKRPNRRPSKTNSLRLPKFH